jgi:hypothetical protein
MNEQNTDQTETQPTQQPIIINNVMGQSDDSGKKKAPSFLKVVVYSCLTGGIYFFYWLVKSLNGGYRKR